jgi:hypothetical protein
MIPDVQKLINQSGNVSIDIFNTRLIKPPTSVLVFPLKVGCLSDQGINAQSSALIVLDTLRYITTSVLVFPLKVGCLNAFGGGYRLCVLCVSFVPPLPSHPR